MQIYACCSMYDTISRCRTFRHYNKNQFSTWDEFILWNCKTRIRTLNADWFKTYWLTYIHYDRNVRIIAFGITKWKRLVKRKPNKKDEKSSAIRISLKCVGKKKNILCIEDMLSYWFGYIESSNGSTSDTIK